MRTKWNEKCWNISNIIYILKNSCNCVNRVKKKIKPNCISIPKESNTLHWIERLIINKYLYTIRIHSTKKNHKYPFIFHKSLSKHSSSNFPFTIKWISTNQLRKNTAEDTVEISRKVEERKKGLVWRAPPPLFWAESTLSPKKKKK